MDAIEKEFITAGGNVGMGGEHLDTIFERVATSFNRSVDNIKHVFYRHHDERGSFTLKHHYRQILSEKQNMVPFFQQFSAHFNTSILKHLLI